MKKFLSIFLTALLASLIVGCASQPEPKKENYNIAYVNCIINFNDYYANSTDSFDSVINKYNNFDSGYTISTTNQFTYFKIKDWDYGENNTIILYLKDGRTLQTSVDNVVLMYETNIKGDQ